MSDTKLTDLTPKQQKFVTGYLEGKSVTVAATDAGYSPTTAARGATELLRSPRVRSVIQDALEAAGVNEDRLAAVINAGLDAMKTTHIVIDGQIHAVQSPDWAARHRFADMVLRLKNSFPAQQVDVTTSYEERLRVLIEQVKPQREAAGRIDGHTS
jgi:hypothetical protein